MMASCLLLEYNSPLWAFQIQLHSNSTTVTFILLVSLVFFFVCFFLKKVIKKRFTHFTDSSFLDEEKTHHYIIWFHSPASCKSSPCNAFASDNLGSFKKFQALAFILFPWGLIHRIRGFI